MKTLSSLVLALALLTVADPRSAASASAASRRVESPHAAPAPAGFSAERLARVDAVLQQYVDENRLAGAVALVLRDGQPAYERAVGWSDKEAGRRMAPNTIFRIASQTKAITSAAILALMEEGKLTLTDPVSRYIPSFAGSKVAVRNDAPGAAPEIVPAKRPITIRDLLTHTAGISYGTDRHVAAHVRSQRAGPGGRLRLVHRRQGRADLRHDGAPRDAAVRRAAGRGLGLRLQHRHPRLRGRSARAERRSTRSCGRASPARSG